MTPDWQLEREKKLLIFGSLDSGPGQVFSGTGIKYAPFVPLTDSGFRVLARAGSGQWRDRKKPLSEETKAEGYVMIGGDQMTGRGTIGIYFGPELAMSIPGQLRASNTNTASIKPPPARAPIRKGAYNKGGARYAPVQNRTATQENASKVAARKTKIRNGLRLQVEIWEHPTPETLVQMSAAISTIKGEFWGRMAAGRSLSFLHPAMEAFVGPEAELSAAGGYAKWRIGGHVTGMRVRGMEFRVSAGREQATDKQRGLYATAGLHWMR